MNMDTEGIAGALLAVLDRFGLTGQLTEPVGLVDGWVGDLQFALGEEEDDVRSDEMAEASAGGQVALTGDAPASPGGDAVAVKLSQGDPCLCCEVRQAAMDDLHIDSILLASLRCLAAEIASPDQPSGSVDRPLACARGVIARAEKIMEQRERQARAYEAMIAQWRADARRPD